MPSSFHEQVQDLFIDALDQAREGRLAFIQQRAQGNAELQAEVCLLLDANDADDDRLNRPAVDIGLSGAFLEP